MTDHEPTAAAPPVAAPPFEAPRPPAPAPAAGGGVAEEKPELLVAGAFAGGAILAIVLKRLGRS